MCIASAEHSSHCREETRALLANAYEMMGAAGHCGSLNLVGETGRGRDAAGATRVAKGGMFANVYRACMTNCSSGRICKEWELNVEV